MEQRAYPITEDQCHAAVAVPRTGQAQPIKLLSPFPIRKAALKAMYKVNKICLV